MRFSRLLLIALLFLTFGVSSAYAQYNFGSSQRNFEITGFYGGRFRGIVNLPNSGTNVDYLKLNNNYDYGVMGDVDLFGPLQAEFMWSREPTDLDAHNFVTGLFSPAGRVTLDNYQWSLLYQLRRPPDKFIPYIAGGVGFTHWGTSVPGTLPFSNNIGFNLGGGVKYFFVRHVGARLDFRWLPSRTTSHVGTVCSPFFGCYLANLNSYAQQVQLNGGLIFRF